MTKPANTDTDDVPAPVRATADRHGRIAQSAIHVTAGAVLVLSTAYSAPITGLTFLALYIARSLAGVGRRYPALVNLMGIAVTVTAITEHWPLAIVVAAYVLTPVAIAATAVWQHRDLFKNDGGPA